MLVSQQENGKGDRDDNNPSDNQVDSRGDNLLKVVSSGATVDEVSSLAESAPK